jgi:hypothetical protein
MTNHGLPTSCPFCRAPMKRNPRLRNRYAGDTSVDAAQYTCGSLMWQGWKSPLNYCSPQPKRIAGPGSSVVPNVSN